MINNNIKMSIICFIILFISCFTIYFNHFRFVYERINNEYHIVDVISNKKEVEIPSYYKDLPVTRICSRAFENKDIEKLTFEENSNITLIERLAFNECTKLKSVEFADSLIEIQNHAFMNCTNLKEVKCNDSLKYIGGSSFYGCSSLEKIYLGVELEIIGSYAFFECSSLKSIEIPYACKYVYNDAFSYCTNLKTIYVSTFTVLFESKNVDYEIIYKK